VPVARVVQPEYLTGDLTTTGDQTPREMQPFFEDAGLP
jgi:hypothetical protein